jgi:serine/threonine protein kinase
MFYELAALKPPFVADSFPALKRVVTAGRYQPLPSKYSSGFHKVISQMLQVQPRNRPTAEAMLRSPEFASKLQLDSLAAAAANQRSREIAHMNLMETIKVPHNLAKMGLPKACYPDVRPNSPSAWTVADQHVQLRKKASPVAAIAEESENAEPETNREPAPVAQAGKVSKLSAIPSSAKVGMVPPLPTPVMSQVPGAYNRGQRVPHPPPVPVSAAVAGVAPPPSMRPPGYYQRAQYGRVV